MPKVMYHPDTGESVTAEDEQVKILEGAGYSSEKPEVKKSKKAVKAVFEDIEDTSEEEEVPKKKIIKKKK